MICDPPFRAGDMRKSRARSGRQSCATCAENPSAAQNTVIGDAEHDPPAARVAERRHLVGERIPAGRGDLSTPELDGLQLQFRILAQRNLLPQERVIHRHRPPCGSREYAPARPPDSQGYAAWDGVPARS